MSVDKARDEFLFLDSVRGAAAVVVVASHLVAGFYPAMHFPSLPPWVRVWYSGDFAVQLFFALSGFVLSLSFVRGGGIESLRSAAVRRYFRLAVPITASVLVSYSLHYLGLYFNREAAAATGQEVDSWLGRWFGFSPSLPRAVDEGLYKSLFAHNLGRTYNAVLWTMQAEFAGSFFVFAFLALFGGLRRRWVVYAALAAVFLRQEWPWASAFLAGVALCDALGGRLPARCRPGTGAVLVLAGLFLGGMTPEWVRASVGWLPRRPLQFHMAAGAALLLLGVIQAGWLRAALLARPLVFLGRLSFPLYLVHILVELSLGCYVFLACRNAGCEPGTAFAAAAAATLVVSLLVAWVGALTVEPLSIYLGKRVYTAFRPAGLPV